MVNNRSKTSLVRHIQKKYITHEDQQYNTRALHFIRDTFFCICHLGSFPIYFIKTL